MNFKRFINELHVWSLFRSYVELFNNIYDIEITENVNTGYLILQNYFD